MQYNAAEGFLSLNDKLCYDIICYLVFLTKQRCFVAHIFVVVFFSFAMVTACKNINRKLPSKHN